MISLTDSKRILGPAAQNLSDGEILSIRGSLQELAEIALETEAENIKARFISSSHGPKQI